MAGDDMDEYSQLKKEVAKDSCKLRALINLYNPGKFPAAVLRKNETVWTSSVTEAYTEVYQIVCEMEMIATTQEQKAEVKTISDGLEKMVQDFTLSYNTKVMMNFGEGREIPTAVPSRAPSSAASEASMATKVRQAEVSVDIDLKKLRGDVKRLSAEIRKVPESVGADNHEIEQAMLMLDTWKGRMSSIRDIMFSIEIGRAHV